MPCYLRRPSLGLLFLALVTAVLCLLALPAVGAGSKADQEQAKEIAKLVRLPKTERGAIGLPLRFYIITHIEMTQKDVKMTTWVTEQQIKQVLLPEINSIWRQAGIQFFLESVVVQPAATVEDPEQSIQVILDAKRDAQGKSDPARVKHINALCDTKSIHPVINCIYLFPYLGQTSQGYASMGGNRTVCGVWTDKPSGAKKPPQKTLLKERRPFKIGSLARTCAHELGHNFMLVHPDKSIQPKEGMLMGGRKHGYSMTLEEMLLARKTAIQRGEKILAWAKKQGG